MNRKGGWNFSHKKAQKCYLCSRPKTLAQLEKLLGKREFGEVCGSHIVRPRGKPTLALASDKRAAYNLGAAEFEGAANA